MTVVCEIAFVVPAKSAASAAATELQRSFATLPGLAWLDLYAPAAGRARSLCARRVCTGAPGDARFRLARGACAGREHAGLCRRPARLSATSCTAMRCVHYPIAGESKRGSAVGAIFLCRALSSPGRRRGGVRPTVSERPSAADRPAAGRPQRGHLRSAALAPCRAGRRPPTICLAMRHVRLTPALSTRRWPHPCGMNCARIIVRCRASLAATRISPWIARALRADRHRVPMRHRASVTTNQAANRANTALSVFA